MSKNIIANDEKEFKKILMENAIEVEFEEQDDEDYYEEIDYKLAKSIDSVLQDMFTSNKFHQIYDWWPICTRFLELDSNCINSKLIEKIQSLLTDIYEIGRVNIHVYDALDSDESQYVGGLNIYNDWLLIQGSVNKLLEKES